MVGYTERIRPTSACDIAAGAINVLIIAAEYDRVFRIPVHARGAQHLLRTIFIAKPCPRLSSVCTRAPNGARSITFETIEKTKHRLRRKQAAQQQQIVQTKFF
jgi:hypothetical protein